MAITHRVVPVSKVVNVPNVSSVVSRVCAPTVDDYREELVLHRLTDLITVRGHVQHHWEGELVNVLQSEIERPTYQVPLGVGGGGGREGGRGGNTVKLA